MEIFFKGQLHIATAELEDAETLFDMINQAYIIEREDPIVAFKSTDRFFVCFVFVFEK